MKKIVFFLVLSFFNTVYNHAQVINSSTIDSLKIELSIATQDTIRASLMAEICQYYKWNRPDSAIHYGNKALLLAKQIKFPKAEIRALEGMVLTHLTIGNDSRALQINLEGIKIAEKNFNLKGKSRFLRHFGELYNRSKKHHKALSFLLLIPAFTSYNFSGQAKAILNNSTLCSTEPSNVIILTLLSCTDRC